MHKKLLHVVTRSLATHARSLEPQSLRAHHVDPRRADCDPNDVLRLSAAQMQCLNLATDFAVTRK